MNERDDEAGGTTSASSNANDPGTNTTSPATSSTADASGIVLGVTLATGVLLAFGFYGVRSAIESDFGQLIPSPFYLLALALLFVIELSRIRSFDARGLARIVGNTAVFGTLVILAIEGGAYLWEQPDAAVDGFSGVVVLAVSLVVAALAYAVYLSTTEAR